MSTIDLHIHTSYSDDGEFSPQEIINKSKAAGMKLISITDHNSVRGIAEIKAVSNELEILAGVELDCTYCGRNFHLLGYGFDYTFKEFDLIEQNIYKQETAASDEKIRLFRKATGFPLNSMEVFNVSRSGIIPGELIAEVVLSNSKSFQYDFLRPYLPGGPKSDMPYVHFYWDFFSEGKPAYVPIVYQSLSDAVSLIHRAGGKAVLAHPAQNLKGDDTLLPGILSEGIDGIEAFSSYHSPDAAIHYLNAALNNKLFITCGSDFHGKNKPAILLGGHGSFWDDPRLANYLSQIFKGKA